MVSTPSSFACDIHDGKKLLLSLPEPAKRIVTLAPNLTEFVFAAGAGDRLVGVSSYSDYPYAATQLPIVSDYHSIDLELIASLQPDLIVAFKGASNAAQLSTLEKIGVPIYWVDIRHLRDIPKTIEQLGCLADTQVRSQSAVDRFIQQYEQLKKRYAALKPVRVFFEMSETPLLTVTHKTVIDDVITLCGGRNIFSYINGVVPIVSLEEVISRNPEAIVSTSRSQDWKALWREWPSLAATQRGAFITLEPDWIERAGPRLLMGANQLCTQLANAR